MSKNEEATPNNVTVELPAMVKGGDQEKQVKDEIESDALIRFAHFVIQVPKEKKTGTLGGIMKRLKSKKKQEEYYSNPLLNSDPEALNHLSSKERREYQEQLEGEDFVKYGLVPRLYHAGLHCKAFWDTFKENIIVLVFTTFERLEDEAEKSSMNFRLNKEKLKEADIEFNFRMQKNGIRFAPSDDAPGTDGKGKYPKDGWNEKTQQYYLEIPKYEPALPWLPTYDPYEHIFGSYLKAKRSFFFPKNRQQRFENICRNVIAVRLLRRIIQDPEVEGGAELNFDRLEGKGIITKVLPGTDHETSEKVIEEWKAIHCPPWKEPLDGIRDYFGERVALYFAFLQSYTEWLLFAGVFGFIVFIYQQVEGNEPHVMESLAIFSVAIALWSVLFTEKWKRNEALYSKEWGTFNLQQSVRYRPAFIESSEVKLQRSYVDGKPEYWKNMFRHRMKGLSSNTLLTLVVGAVVVAILSIFLFRVAMANADRISEEWAGHIASILTAVQIQVMGTVYSKFAHFLVNWENHPTQQEHESSLALKLSCFQILNSYLSLFYIAFVKNDGRIITHVTGETETCDVNPDTDKPDCMYELQWQLLIIFLMRIGMNFVKTLVMPLIMEKLKRPLTVAKAKILCRPVPPEVKLPHDEEELEKESWDPFDDYLDLLIQFGFVTLFIAAFPLGPLVAFIANIGNLHLDSFRLIKFQSRPYPRRENSIGAWGKLLKLLSVLSIITNFSVMVFTVDVPWFGLETSLEKLAAAAVAEHAILTLKYAIVQIIPNVPLPVQIQQERQEVLVNRHLLDAKLPDEKEAEKSKKEKNQEIKKRSISADELKFKVGKDREHAISTYESKKILKDHRNQV